MIIDHDLAKANHALASGLWVIYPTETFYALGAALNQTAVAGLQEAKGREPNKPIALIAANAKVVHDFAPLPKAFALLTQAFWPGPLTLLVTPYKEPPQGIAASDGTVGVRVSPHPTARALAQAAGGLITATSANLAGESPVVRPDELHPKLRGQAAVVLDGGVCPGGAPSTLLGLRDGKITVVREGAISRAQLKEILGFAPQ